MAPSPLPTELISHILELLYDDVRTRDVVGPAEWDKWHGVKVPSIFFPILTVSKTFHALALPILYRHIFLAEKSESSSGFPSDDQISHRNLEWTRAIRLRIRNDDVVYRELLRDGFNLQTLDIYCTWSFNPLLKLFSCFPSTLVALNLKSTSMILARSDLAALSTALPNLRTLQLSIEWISEMDALPPSVWKLEYLHCLRVRGAASPLLQWLDEAKETLRTLVIEELVLTTDPPMMWIDEELLQGLSAPMTALQSLDTNNFNSDVDLISAERFPALTHLCVAVDASKIRSILTTATTLEIAEVAVPDLDHSDPSVIAVIVEFLTGHPTIKRFDLEVEDDGHGNQINVVPSVWWGKPIVELCTERGILFFCDHGGAFGEDWEAEWAPSNDDEDNLQSSIGSSGIEDADDFDAEEEELWAQHWSVEKREASAKCADTEETTAPAASRLLRRLPQG